MVMMVTVVEEGDIIVVNKTPWSGRVDDSKYYIMRDDALVEVPWYEAEEYQKPFAEKVKASLRNNRRGG